MSIRERRLKAAEFRPLIRLRFMRRQRFCRGRDLCSAPIHNKTKGSAGTTTAVVYASTVAKKV